MLLHHISFHRQAFIRKSATFNEGKNKSNTFDYRKGISSVYFVVHISDKHVQFLSNIIYHISSAFNFNAELLRPQARSLIFEKIMVRFCWLEEKNFTPPKAILQANDV